MGADQGNQDITRATHAGRPCILVVDDDCGTQRLMRRALEAEGYEVVLADGRAQAIDAFRDNRPDIVIMDASTPSMDGFDACAALRMEPGGEQTPVLIVTALDDDVCTERAFDAGASDFIVKPINWTILRQRVRRMIKERRAEKHLNYLAYHDDLTGLPNRAMLVERLDRALADCPEGQMVALLFLDLDGFKLINDTLGHEAGDELLERIGVRLTSCMRGADLVARLGGDEFSIVLPSARGEADVRDAAERVLAALVQPVELREHEIYVGGSIGIAVFPHDGDDAGTLLKNADTAMYRAKDQGRNTYQFYAAEMGTQLLVRMSLQSSLRRALERREFLVYYQPVVALDSGNLIGAEALVRWQHPQLGLVSPAQFIPLAEDTGLIDPLGEWVLSEACRRAAEWRELRQAPVRVTVNISGKQFRNRHLVGRIRDTLNDFGLEPGCIGIEITENVIMSDTRQSIEMLTELKELGITVSVDDFGTGYSSLSYLKRLPLDALKVDRSFVGNVPNAVDDCAIVEAIVALAKSLRLGVIAEGVETREQMAFLTRLRCDAAQGYYFGRPGPGDWISNLIRDGAGFGLSRNAGTQEEQARERAQELAREIRRKAS